MVNHVFKTKNQRNCTSQINMPKCNGLWLATAGSLPVQGFILNIPRAHKLANMIKVEVSAGNLPPKQKKKSIVEVKKDKEKRKENPIKENETTNKKKDFIKLLGTFGKGSLFGGLIGVYLFRPYEYITATALGFGVLNSILCFFNEDTQKDLKSSFIKGAIWGGILTYTIGYMNISASIIVGVVTGILNSTKTLIKDQISKRKNKELRTF